MPSSLCSVESIKWHPLASAHGGDGGAIDCAPALAIQGCWVDAYGRGPKTGGAHETITQSHHLAKTGWSATRLRRLPPPGRRARSALPPRHETRRYRSGPCRGIVREAFG